MTFCVEAHGHDYSSTVSFVRSMSRTGNFGHAWIRLQSPQSVWIGGHSGERESTYFEGVMELIDTKDPNPIRYLWGSLQDGYCEMGSGGHKPTSSLTVMITEEKYYEIVDYIKKYPFDVYSLSDHQCCSFVIGVAQLVGLELNADTVLEIDSAIIFKGERLPLWNDPAYNRFEFCSPEALEISINRME